MPTGALLPLHSHWAPCIGTWGWEGGHVGVNQGQYPHSSVVKFCPQSSSSLWT